MTESVHKPMFHGYSMNHAWLSHLISIATAGDVIKPRGLETRELLHRTIRVDMRRSVLSLPERKLNYRFMAAEAYWILTGDNTVAGIAPYNSQIAKFSDNGLTFFGAYGPPIIGQLPYVLRTLMNDRDSRQAGLTIWQQCPPPTKDVPCTVAMFFQIRGAHLFMSVYMRSSDVWLGLPYDVFVFSMVGHLICAEYNSHARAIGDQWFLNPATISPGGLAITAASSHVYNSNEPDILRTMEVGCETPSPESPETLFESKAMLLHVLDILRHSKPGDPHRWWEKGPDHARHEA